MNEPKPPIKTKPRRKVKRSVKWAIAGMIIGPCPFMLIGYLHPPVIDWMVLAAIVFSFVGATTGEAYGRLSDPYWWLEDTENEG